MLDLKMIKLKSKQNLFVIMTILCTLFFSPLIAYSDEYSNRIISTNDSPYDVSLQYQIRDNSQNLVCVVESKKISYYDSSITRQFLDSHPNKITMEKNNELVNYVLVKDSYRQGEGDTFLSVLRIIFVDQIGQQFNVFFATTNGCAVEPGDMVTVYWKIYYV